jgi:hypothetical protein
MAFPGRAQGPRTCLNGRHPPVCSTAAARKRLHCWTSSEHCSTGSRDSSAASGAGCGALALGATLSSDLHSAHTRTLPTIPSWLPSILSRLQLLQNICIVGHNHRTATGKHCAGEQSGKPAWRDVPQLGEHVHDHRSSTPAHGTTSHLATEPAVVPSTDQGKLFKTSGTCLQESHQRGTGVSGCEKAGRSQRRQAWNCPRQRGPPVPTLTRWSGIQYFRLSDCLSK